MLERAESLATSTALSAIFGWCLGLPKALPANVGVAGTEGEAGAEFNGVDDVVQWAE